MRRATEFSLPGDWPSAQAVDRATLVYDDRRRRRLRLTADSGEAFLLDLPEAAILPDGSGLYLDDGSWIHVLAAAEPVAQITCSRLGDLVQVAWHLGNRHLPTEITDEALYVRQDHVIEQMATGLGAQVTRLNRPFNPEGGAYGGHPTHGHDRDDDPGHAPTNGRGQDHAHAHPHRHDRETERG